MRDDETTWFARSMVQPYERIHMHSIPFKFWHIPVNYLAVL